MADGLDHLQKDTAEAQTLPFAFISLQKSKPVVTDLFLLLRALGCSAA